MAAETFRIEIPVLVQDQTEPGVGSATKKVNGFDKAVKQTQERLDKMNRTRYEVAVEALDKASSVVGRIQTTLKGVVGKAWGITMNVIDKATAPIRGIINILKSPILQAGAVLGISFGLKDTIDTYSTFEATMSKVKALSNANAEQMAALTQKAKDMGATTKYSGKESAEAFTYMAQAGWSVQDMVEGIGGVMNLAASDGLDLASTTDIVANALTAFGLKAKDAAGFADVLATASSATNTDVAGLGEAFKYVAPVAGAMNYSIQDVSAALGIMSNNAVKGSMAGTSLKTALANMAAPTDQMAEAMSKYGISLKDREGNMKSLRQVMENLRSSMGKLSSSEKTAAASTIFGKEAMSGMLSIINASDEDWNSLIEQIDNASGSAKRMADTMQDNLAGAIEQLGGAAETVKISVGERLKPHLQRFVTWLTAKMPLVEKAAGEVMDFVDEKIAWLSDTVNEFMSGEDWENADIWGKIKIAWDKVVAEPFSEWWNGTGKSWIADKMQGFGKGIGSGITAGLLAILGIDLGNATADGKSVGGAFVEGFKDGFDTAKITEALKTWASNNKGIAAGLGVVLGGKLIGGIAKGVKEGKSLYSDIKSILGKGSNSGLPGMGGLGGGAYTTTTMTVTASVVNVYGNSLNSAASKAANAASAASSGGNLLLPGASSAGRALLGSAGRALLGSGGSALPSGGALALPGGGGAAAAAEAAKAYTVYAPTAAKGTSVVMGTTGSAVTAGLANTGYALGSGASTIGGAAAVGGGSILGAIGGLIGIGAGVHDIFQGSKKSGKEAQDEYFQGGSKIGMVGAGAAAGAGIGALFGGVGAAPGALIGAGIGGIASLGIGDKIGKALSDAVDEGGWLNNMGQAISGFFTETLPEKWGEFWGSVGDLFTETIPYALGYAAGKVQIFFTETLPSKWTEFWDGVGNFFTETLPTWWESVKAGAANFFTVTLPSKWTEFWSGVGDFFTETIPTWWENVKAGAANFFTVTIPAKWTEFWTGIGDFFTETIPTWWKGMKETVSNFFTVTIPNAWNNFWSGLWDNVSGFFGSVGENFSAGHAAATKHAWGGIMSKPHMGIVAEDGAESIIPLSPSKRARGIDLWEQTGQNLGVLPYANGGIVGDTEDAESVPVDTSGAGGGPKVDVHLELSPQFIIQARESGINEEGIVAIIKARIGEMVDDISDELAERLARIFANMPVKGVT